MNSSLRRKSSAQSFSPHTFLSLSSKQAGERHKLTVRAAVAAFGLTCVGSVAKAIMKSLEAQGELPIKSYYAAVAAPMGEWETWGHGGSLQGGDEKEGSIHMGYIGAREIALLREEGK